MLKFSGFAGLTSCLGEAHKDARFAKGLLPTQAKESRAIKAIDTMLSIGEPNTLHVPRAPWNTLTHKHAQQHHHNVCREDCWQKVT